MSALSPLDNLHSSLFEIFSLVTEQIMLVAGLFFLLGLKASAERYAAFADAVASSVYSPAAFGAKLSGRGKDLSSKTWDRMNFTTRISIS